MLEFYCTLVEDKVIPQVEYFDKLNIGEELYAGTVAWVSDASSYCDSAIENGYEMVAAPYTVTNSSDSVSGWYAKSQGIEKGIPLSKSALAYLEEDNLLIGI
ncbi:MAG: hypothetical protein LUE12_00130 [Ruminococcus sp.]|nr:hypothetical protein [Ruminococcus sp.]